VSGHEAWTDRLDPEQLDLIAAYLDGALAADDRSRVEALLARSEAAREVLAEALSALESHGDKSASPRARRGLFWRVAIPMAAAAVMATVLLWPEPNGLDVARWTGQLAPASGVAPLGLPVARGVEVPPTGVTGAAVRAGVRLVDSRIAASAGDDVGADTLLLMLAGELRALEGTGAVVGRVEGLVGLSGARVAGFDAVESALTDRFGSPFRAALVLEALRVAAAVGERELASELLAHALLERALAEDGIVFDRTSAANLGRWRLVPATDVDGASVEETVAAVLRAAAR
jgi:hypothetical protein